MTAKAANAPPRDDEGYLLDPADWSESVAESLAHQEGLTLTDLHRQILRFMRTYFEEHHIAPDARYVIRFLANELAEGARAKTTLFALFPYGYVKQACKIAGMRRPRAWSTG